MRAVCLSPFRVRTSYDRELLYRFWYCPSRLGAPTHEVGCVAGSPKHRCIRTCFPPEVAPPTLRSTPRSRHRRRRNFSTTAPDLAQDGRRELTGSQPRRASLLDIRRSAKLRLVTPPGPDWYRWRSLPIYARRAAPNS